VPNGVKTASWVVETTTQFDKTTTQFDKTATQFKVFFTQITQIPPQAPHGGPDPPSLALKGQKWGDFWVRGKSELSQTYISVGKFGIGGDLGRGKVGVG
jgi:hypothetical protein